MLELNVQGTQCAEQLGDGVARGASDRLAICLDLPAWRVFGCVYQRRELKKIKERRAIKSRPGPVDDNESGLGGAHSMFPGHKSPCCNTCSAGTAPVMNASPAFSAAILTDFGADASDCSRRAFSANLAGFAAVTVCDATSLIHRKTMGASSIRSIFERKRFALSGFLAGQTAKLLSVKMPSITAARLRLRRAHSKALWPFVADPHHALP